MAERKKSVVIDPGHGGSSNLGGSSWQGAASAGPSPVLEKDLTLSLAQAVKKRLDSTCEVTLTRNSDVNLSLAARAKVAQDCHADLFLSVHFNSAADAAVDGTETWVAKQASEASKKFALTVLQHVANTTGAANRGVRPADFGVLVPARHDPHTAACLVEVAFLTNPAEARRLRDPVYLGNIADALADAVKAHTAVALAHAAVAGAGSGGGSSVALLEPDPVDDERNSAATMSTAELERLYGLQLDVVIKTVVNSDARIRGGPPSFAVQGHKKIAQYTKVKVEEVNGDYSRVSAMDATALGWTASSNLGAYFKDDSALASVALAPAAAIAIDASWGETKKAVAGVYNRLGGLMRTLASTTHIDLAAALAVWFVESHGRSHTKGKAIIRLEAHLLFDHWGHLHEKDFDLHFQFGTRPPKTGNDCKARMSCQEFRAGDTGPFQPYHDHQDREYAALAEATTLAGEETAIQCISMGGPQILGSNHQLIGYNTAKQMYDAFQDNERSHVLGFFDYCQFVQSRGALLEHLRKQEWEAFTRGYNGTGNVAEYSKLLKNAFAAATAVLPTPAPVSTKSLGVELGSAPVDLNFKVELIPQPDKLSCWAASMSMLLSYYRQASMTPESLAQQVGLSLRRSYGWDMLEAVRSKFLFKEIKQHSNLSYVPPPEDWFHWLEQYGPLWVTLRGSPSHAVVVSGITGDLTPGHTSIHLLNPWDINTKFDKDPIDFHPANHGIEETLSYDDFSKAFGNMGLANYGHWRILYLGRLATAQGLDARDLTPEEIADAEVSRGLNIHGLTAEEIADAEPVVHPVWAEAAGTRPVLGEADVRWAPDDRNIDYRHLAAAFDPHPFTFTPALLERLCALNRFDVKAGQHQVLFGLRGCQFAGDAAPTGWVSSANLSEAVPDHKNARCILGVWNRSTGQFRLFTGSTVPNWKLMERFREGGDHANMLPTGRYLFHVGTHRPGSRGEVRGAFLEHGDVVVLRTLNDLEYAIGDVWDSGNFGDNIHPARLDGGAHAPFFSSAGCQTVPGNVYDGRHTGKWAEFRTAAGLSASSPGSEDGRRFVYAMLTGRDARLIAQGKQDAVLMRLRFGSSGADVTALQLGLSGSGFLHGGSSGTLDTATKMAYIRWQTARDAHAADGIVTPSTGKSLGFDMIQGQSIGVTHALETRAATPDEVVTQIDQLQKTSYGSYTGYRSKLVDGRVFGQNISGLRPGFLKKLQAGEAAAAKAIGGSPPAFGIVSAGGFRTSDGFHGWGLAVDLNYDSCPYIMHNRGLAAIDRQLEPVYTRIAGFLLQRESKIPAEITKGNRDAKRIEALYDWLAEESNAMIRYFQLMQDTAKLSAAIAALPANADWRPISGGGAAPNADAMQDQMMKDYVTLAGRSGPAVSGKSYPAAPKDASHRPFHGNPKLRGPERGFLSLRKELVIALTAQGLRWGAIHFGRESGDVMHFDDGFAEGVGILTAKAAAKKAIAAGQSMNGAALAAIAACAADIPIDDRSAVIFSDEAPLAKTDCERKAVWAAVPDPLRHPFSVLIYFHGNNAAVLADAQHPEGVFPKWNRVARPSPSSLTPGGPFTPGTRDNLAAAAQAAPQRPLVLIPEDGVPSSQSAFWAETGAGALQGDPAALSRLVDDAWGHLANLRKPSGGPYLPGGAICPVERRVLLAGHSGGGLPLGFAASSVMARNIPTDLWLLDCTYYDLDEYAAFCRSWKRKSHLGNDAQSSRMVVITTAGKTRTRVQNILLPKLLAAQSGQPALTSVQFTQGKFTGGSTTPPTGSEIVIVRDDAKWAEIDLCLRSFPVVVIETKIAHGRIPHDFFPHLLDTAAVP
jgi:N-acetylmuramoyl-L-alanine amidase